MINSSPSSDVTTVDTSESPRFVPSDRSRELQEKAHRFIPGGCHTYNKGDDQFPYLAPTVLVRGKGCHVWDADGNEFIEYGMGSRAVTLGHGFEPVVEAACDAMRGGTNYTRPSLLEVEYAEQLVDLIGSAEQVKFSKDGSTVTTAAMKLARAYTGRDKIARCADHPFFSYDDWFIGTTPMDAGIPQSTKDEVLTFRYDDLDSLRSLFEAHPDQIAAIILEPVKYSDPSDGYLQKAKEICHDHGALFILDEMITGFRLHLQGAQAYYGVEADLSTFGKGMTNGFALSALMGRRDIMEVGGFHHDRERVFLLSTTHGSSHHAIAAGRATLDVYKKENVIDVLYAQGERLRTGVQQVIDAAGMGPYVKVFGKPCNLVFATLDAEENSSQAFRTLFMQELIQHGILAPSFVVSYSHSDDDIDYTIEAVAKALEVYKEALANGVDEYLVGPSVQPVFRPYANR